MSTVPELLVARHANIPTLGISCITNMAAGITGKELNHLEVEAVAKRVNNEFKSLIKLLITKCKKALRCFYISLVEIMSIQYLKYFLQLLHSFLLVILP